MAAVEEDEDDKLLDDETVRGLPNIMGAIKVSLSLCRACACSWHSITRATAVL